MALLLLADARLPAGGHAHSGGLEEAVTAGRLGDLVSLERFLTGRLATAGLSAAALAATACRCAALISADWHALDAEADARLASPALRASSRRQGRQLLRAAKSMWGGAVLDALGHASPPAGPQHPLALGVAGAAAGVSPTDAALVAAYGSITGPASAAVRLLSLDPVAVHAMVAGLASATDDVARRAAAAAEDGLGGTVESLPCPASPLLDIGAEWQAWREVRLFAS